MRLDGGAVVGADVDVDAEHLRLRPDRAGPPRGVAMSAAPACDAQKISEPPWAMPVSTIRSGWIVQISSCIATMSCGYWMIGRPSQAKLYEYFAAATSA